MALVIETGSGDDPSANSFATLAEIRAFNEARGRTVPVDASLEPMALKAMDYLNSLEYLGWRTFGLLQLLEWPRQGVIIDGVYWDADVIPQDIINAQAELVGQLIEGVPLQASSTGAAQVKRKKVGPIETEWFQGQSVAFMPKVNTWLRKWLSNGIGQGLRNVRI